MIVAGKLRHRIRVLKPKRERDADGGIVLTHVEEAIRWGSVEPIRGREFWEANQVNADVTHRVRMRSIKDLTTSHVLEHRGRRFEIETIIDPDERRIETEMLCRETKASA